MDMTYTIKLAQISWLNGESEIFGTEDLPIELTFNIVASTEADARIIALEKAMDFTGYRLKQYNLAIEKPAPSNKLHDLLLEAKAVLLRALDFNTVTANGLAIKNDVRSFLVRLENELKQQRL